MTCPACGYAMSAFDTECPRCHGKGIANPTTSTPTSNPPTQAVAPSPRPDTITPQAPGKNPLLACFAIGCLGPVVLLFLAIIFSALGGSGTGGSEHDGYVTASSNLWSGVKLYYGKGETKTYVFEVLGGNDNYTSPTTGQNFRGLKVRYPNGNEEWKDRDYIISGDLYWIKSDDPALSQQRWETYTF